MAARLHSHIVLSLLLLLLLPATTAAASYSSLCHSPAAAHDTSSHVSPLTLPPRISTGHFSGGGDLNFAPGRYYKHAFSFSPRLSSANATDDPATIHLSATLTLRGTRLTRGHGAHHHSVSFDLQGYYYYSSTANATSELCMVGSGSYASEENGSGVVTLSDVVLQLSLPHPSSLARPFVTGSLEAAGFNNHIALTAYAEDDYAYGETASCPAEAPPGVTRRQVLGAGFSCTRLRALLGMGSRSSYTVEYMPSNGSGGFPLRLRHGIMYVNQMRCGTNGAVRAYMVFFTNRPADASPSSNDTVAWRWRRGFLVGDEALVADGFWDSSTSRFCLKACRVDQSSGKEELGVGECGIRVSFWFPAVWSIRDRSVVTGMIWNASSNSDGGNISAGVISVSRTAWSYMDRLSGITYNYTRVEEAKKHYESMSALGEERKGRFPGNYSYRDFAFGFSLKEQGFTGFTLKEQGFTGYASPVTIGSALVEGDELRADVAFQAEVVNKQRRLLNVSYTLQYHAPQLRRVWAEGVYDTKNGSLCMVACQVIGNVSSDCEVLVTVQFAPMDGVARERAVGTISSIRNQSDPLFFQALDFVGDGMYVNDLAKSGFRMDMESVMLVASMVLSCVFTGLQLRHVKHHPEALPATSVTMLVVLALGYAIPLVLSLEDMYKNSLKQYFVKLTSGGAPELNEFMQRVTTMLALALQLRLLQLALSRRSADQAAGKHEGSSSSSSWSDAERSTLWICLPLYALGAAAVCIAHDLSDGHKGLFALPGPAIVDDLVAYGGLVLDGFLLPQVVWNAFAGSTLRALSPWFYVGGTVVRTAPDAYDMFRKGSYVASRRPSFVYASPRDGLFSIGWDVAVPCVAALLAALVFSQQRFGGAFLCGLKRRRPGGYEMVSTPGS